MESSMRVLCPDCGEVSLPKIVICDKGKPVDFRGDETVLVDDVIIRIVINCPKCERENIFEAFSGPLFFDWVGP